MALDEAADQSTDRVNPIIQSSTCMSATPSCFAYWDPLVLYRTGSKHSMQLSFVSSLPSRINHHSSKVGLRHHSSPQCTVLNTPIQVDALPSRWWHSHNMTTSLPSAPCLRSWTLGTLVCFLPVTYPQPITALRSLELYAWHVLSANTIIPQVPTMSPTPGPPRSVHGQ